MWFKAHGTLLAPVHSTHGTLLPPVHAITPTINYQQICHVCTHIQEMVSTPFPRWKESGKLKITLSGGTVSSVS